MMMKMWKNGRAETYEGWKSFPPNVNVSDRPLFSPLFTWYSYPAISLPLSSFVLLSFFSFLLSFFFNFRPYNKRQSNPLKLASPVRLRNCFSSLPPTSPLPQSCDYNCPCQITNYNLILILKSFPRSKNTGQYSRLEKQKERNRRHFRRFCVRVCFHPPICLTW